MAIEYTYDPGDGTIRTRIHGVITAGDMCDYVEEIAGLEDLEPGFIEIVDMEQATDIEIRYHDTGALKGLWPRFAAKGPRGSVVYAPTDLAFGLMRMIQTVLTMDDDAAGPQFIVARTLEEVAEHVAALRAGQGAPGGPSLR